MHMSEALSQYATFEHQRVQLGLIRPATLRKQLELANKAGSCLPDIPISELHTPHFRGMLADASKTYGPSRLRALLVWLRFFLRWSVEEGILDSEPSTKTLRTPKLTPKPKHLYSPEQLRTMLQQRPLIAAITGLGLWAGCNCSDVSSLSASHFDGHWFTMPRVKTGVSRLAYVPSWTLAALGETGMPIQSKYGLLKRTSIPGLWRKETAKLLGKALPFTGLRTTLRSVVGHVDPEAVELSVMGLSDSASAGQSVAVRHYINRDAINKDRLRTIANALTEYVQSS